MRGGERKGEKRGGKIERLYSRGVLMHIPLIFSPLKFLIPQWWERNQIAYIRWKPVGDPGVDQKVWLWLR